MKRRLDSSDHMPRCRALGLLLRNFRIDRFESFEFIMEVTVEFVKSCSRIFAVGTGHLVMMCINFEVDEVAPSLKFCSDHAKFLEESENRVPDVRVGIEPFLHPFFI